MFLMMILPFILIALIAGIVFAVKASRAKRELLRLKQILLAQQE
jgi:hypothetical protein